MATAPFQLWIDIPAVASASRTGSTVEVTTDSAHGLTTGTFVQLEGFSGSAGDTMNGVFPATVTSATKFTVSDSGSAGAGTVTSAVVSRDLFTPLIDIASADRSSAAYAITDGITMSASGDGNSTTIGFNVSQDTTPSGGPWWSTVPDQARVRLYKADSATTPTDADLYFIGTVASISASLNESGQGSTVMISADEVNAILDKLTVIGQPISAVNATDEGGFVRTGGTASGTVTVTCAKTHGYPLGQQVTIAGVIGGGGNMNGTQTITAISGKTFKYSSNGIDGTGDSWLTPIGAVLASGSKQTVELQFSSAHNLVKGSTVTLRNFVCSTAKFTTLLNATYSGAQNVGVPSSTKLLVRMSAPLDTTQTVTTRGQVQGDATIVPVGGSDGQSNFSIISGLSEDAAVVKALSRVNDGKDDDAMIQRLLSTSTTTNIVGAGSSSSNTIGMTFPSGSLRSVLDGIVEAFSGEDKKQRRYWIGLDRTLNYKLVDTTSQPTYTNAPYKIVTSGTQNPDTTSAAATVMPYELNVNYDHNTVKNALFNISSDSGGVVSKVQNYTDAGYSTRKGAPVFDSVVDYPTSTSDAPAAVKRAAKSYFLEQHAPLQTVTFSLRGAGTAAHNSLGFSAGYYQTGASTFALQKRWEPGQWVDISCSQLNLTGVFRVEQVDWNLSQGSFLQEITITANRRNPNAIVNILKAGR